MKTQIPYQLGDKVTITHTTKMDYVKQDEKYYRKAITTQLQTPITAIIVGAVYRPLGIYHKPCGYSGYDEPYIEPAYLEVKGTILLLKCAVRLFGKAFEVQLEHISKI